MTPEELAELERLAREWRHAVPWRAPGCQCSECAFLAAARDAVPRLIARVRELEAERDLSCGDAIAEATMAGIETGRREALAKICTYRQLLRQAVRCLPEGETLLIDAIDQEIGPWP